MVLSQNPITRLLPVSVSCASHKRIGRLTEMASAAPAQPATYTVVHREEIKCRARKIQLIPSGVREVGGRDRKGENDENASLKGCRE